MNQLKLSENILRLRHERKLTQDELAAFLGVTKASVSKWETQQSLPDLLLLPQLASFFDVTVDELLGYEPQLDKEQIRKLYHTLKRCFTDCSFDDAMSECEAYVKRYYSCYPVLIQICVLWVNHCTLAGSQEETTAVLNRVLDLCSHILAHCTQVSVNNNTIALQSFVRLQLGEYSKVIETLEQTYDSYGLASQSGHLLTQAYLACQDFEKAAGLIQISLYESLMNLVTAGIYYLVLHTEDLKLCETLMKRIDQAVCAFDFQRLHPNIVGNYQYQAAIVYCTHGMEQEALSRLEQFMRLIRILFSQGLTLHGDSFFNRLDSWFQDSDLGTQSVREPKLVARDVLQAFEHPAFAILQPSERFQQLKTDFRKDFEL